jgi:putative ABC transport system substrate-binding protein
VWDALLDGLRERGYHEGRNLVFERRFSEGHAARFPAFAAEMVQLRVDLILVTTEPAALAAKHATQTIPIIIPTAIDPVEAGLVASLARPGGNVTGLSQISPDLVGKRLELLKEVVPGLARVVVLWNAANPANTSAWQETQAAARALDLRLHAQDVQGPQDLDGAFARTAQTRPDALFVLSDALLNMYRQRIQDALSRAWHSFIVSRYSDPGLAQTHLQYVLTAVALNGVHWGAWWLHAPTAKTRCSPFAALRVAVA